MIDDIHDVIGLIGVFLILISYVLLQLERIKANSLSYSIINLVGAILILYSLFYNWNLSSVIIESFWIIISLFGVGKSLRYKRKHPNSKEISGRFGSKSGVAGLVHQVSQIRRIGKLDLEEPTGTQWVGIGQ